MEKGDIKSVEEFYRSIDKIKKIRKKVFSSLEKGKETPAEFGKLQEWLIKLKNIPKDGKDYFFYTSNGIRVMTRLKYEIEELRKDIIYLKQGEKGLERYMKKSHNNFSEEKKNIVEYLKSAGIDSFVTDRDGTVNNYSERYLSSTQPVYNAIYLRRLMKGIKNKIILTSAPLKELMEVTILPENEIVFGGSRGREFKYRGKTKKFFISKRERKKLKELSSKVHFLLNGDYKKFYFIGSGVQHKFGGITLARQDISGSVKKGESKEFLDSITEKVNEIDPKRKYFDIKDTGLDVEISLKWRIKIFDKGSGLGFITDSLHKNPNTILMCGDTLSDISLVEKSKKIGDKIYVVFVTKSKNLKKQVKKICPQAKFASSPDVLISALNEVSKYKKSKNGKS